MPVTHRHDRSPSSASALDAGARPPGERVGFVPTMGYLHDGPRVADAGGPARDRDVVVASIFVNPLQFGADRGPRRLPPRPRPRHRPGRGRRRRPRVRARRVEEMYPDGAVLTTVTVGEVSDAARGRGPARPTSTASPPSWPSCSPSSGPCRAYFGEKDFQQLAVVRRMVARPVDPGRGGRLPDGPRARRAGHVEPQRLPHPEERAAAPVLHRALAGRRGRHRRRASATPPRCGRSMADLIDGRAARRARLRRGRRRRHPRTCPTRWRATLRLLVAARFGRARLIDNVGATVGATV